MNRIAILGWSTVVQFCPLDTQLAFSRCCRLSHQIANDEAQQWIRRNLTAVVQLVASSAVKPNQKQKRHQERDDDEEGDSLSDDSDEEHEKRDLQQRLLLLDLLQKNHAHGLLAHRFLVTVSHQLRRQGSPILQQQKEENVTISSCYHLLGNTLFPARHGLVGARIFNMFAEHCRTVFGASQPSIHERRRVASQIEMPDFGLAQMQAKPTWPTLTEIGTSRQRLRLVYLTRELFESSTFVRDISNNRRRFAGTELDGCGALLGRGLAFDVRDSGEEEEEHGDREFVSWTNFVECGSGGVVQLCIFCLFDDKRLLSLNWSLSSSQDDEILSCRRAGAASVDAMIAEPTQVLLSTFRELLPPTAEGDGDPENEEEAFIVPGARLASLSPHFLRKGSSSTSNASLCAIDALKQLTSVVQNSPRSSEKSTFLVDFFHEKYFERARELVQACIVAKQGIKTVHGVNELSKNLTTPKGIYFMSSGTFQVRRGNPLAYLEHGRAMFNTFLTRNQSRMEFLLGSVVPIGAIHSLIDLI